MGSAGQMDLFSNEPAQSPAAPPGRISPAPLPPPVHALASRLSRNLRLGGSTWSFPGWKGTVYAGSHTPAQLAERGLTAYASHPLLRAVGIDRSFYAPLPAQTFRDYAEQVPDDFRFVVKAHEHCTLSQFPLHERYGAQRGQKNPLFLDPVYAAEQVVAPVLEGLGPKAGVLLFQLPPQDIAALGGVDDFVNRLYRFLRALPAGVLYAVEVRNEELLTDRYAKALEYAGAIPALSGWSRMPPLLEQAKRTRALERQALFVRWMLHWNTSFEEAEARYSPFDKIVDADPETRAEIVALAREALGADLPVYVVAANNAEGCAPRTLQAIAEALE